MTAFVTVDYEVPEMGWLDGLLEAISTRRGGRWIGSGRDLTSEHGRRDIEFQFSDPTGAQQFVAECGTLRWVRVLSICDE
jgi:hypothetical protein